MQVELLAGKDCLPGELVLVLVLLEPAVEVASVVVLAPVVVLVAAVVVLGVGCATGVGGEAGARWLPGKSTCCGRCEPAGAATGGAERRSVGGLRGASGAKQASVVILVVQTAPSGW